MYPDLAKKHIKEEPVTERQLVPFIDINDVKKLSPEKLETEKVKRTLQIFKEQSAKYKQGDLPPFDTPDFRQMMAELKDEW